MDISVSVLLFVIGSTFGSFLNVLIDRLSTGRPIAKGRSYCESCKKTLKPQDLVPVLSYILLRGKCRYCHAQIPIRILLVEVLSGLSLLFVYWYLLTNASLGLLSFVGVSLVVLSFIGILFADIEYGIIPDKLVISSLVGALLYVFAMQVNWGNHILSGLGAGIFFLLLFTITRGRGMGFGDVKIAFVLGLLLGFPHIIVALYMAFLTGAVVSIILVIWRKLRFFGTTIPFGPFLVVSTLAALFYGNEITAFALKYLFNY